VRLLLCPVWVWSWCCYSTTLESWCASDWRLRVAVCWSKDDILPWLLKNKWLSSVWV
jgi:hypothetical protein